MTKTQARAGERLPYLLAKLKAPRVLERLEQTAASARAESWPYEQFLEALLEAEVFARDASGARQRIRHAAFPARKTLEDFDWQAQPAAECPLVTHLAQLAWIDEHANVCFFGPPGTGKSHLAIALAKGLGSEPSLLPLIVPPDGWLSDPDDPEGSLICGDCATVEEISDWMGGLALAEQVMENDDA